MKQTTNEILSTEEGRAPFLTRMRELREGAGKSQQECADALGIHQPGYSLMESGARRIRRSHLVTLAALYGMSLSKAFPGAR